MLVRAATVTFEPTDSASPVARDVVGRYFAEIGRRFGFDPSGETEKDARLFTPPAGVFVVAVSDGEPVACGGLHTIAPGTGEHGSAVRNISAGGHLFVLSDLAAEAARFRAEDSARRAEYLFAASFHSGQDLQLMEEVKLPLGARALPAALADFRAGVPDGAAELLEEMSRSDLTLANLYLRTIVEEVPEMTMVGEALRPDMFERLRELESFRDYEAKVRAEAEAEADAAVKAQMAEVKAQAAEVKAETEADTTADNLADFLIIRGDAPSEHALDTISACRKADVLAAWLKRAYLGETSAQLFPEPKPPTS